MDASRMRKQKEILRWVRIVVLKTLKDKRLSHLDHETLVSAGYYGYTQALQRYSFEKGAKFKTYAEYRIKGAVLDEVRKIIGDERRKTKKPTKVYDYDLENISTSQDFEDEVNGNIDIQKMWKHLKYSLSDKELKILQYRVEGNTLKEIGKKFKLTEDEAAVILEKVKKNACVYFQDYLEENLRIETYACQYCKKQNQMAENIVFFDCEYCGKRNQV